MPIICVDGCHLESKYKGVYLIADAIDPNDCIFPIYNGYGRGGVHIFLGWFLTTLKHDLNIINTSPFYYHG